MTLQTQPSIQHSWLVRRSPIFYGWVVWLAATLGLSATSPGQSFSVSLFIDHYIKDFNLNRATVSGLYGLGTFLASLALVWVGRQIDQYGNRRMSIVITLLFALALLACSLITGPITILLSFIAIRGLGQGSLGLVSTTAIAGWFQRRRGMAIGLSLVSFAIFQRFYLPGLQSFIENHGWRNAWLLLGMSIGVLILPTLSLLLRDRPEQFGLLPDGKIDELFGTGDVMVEENWQLGEAMRIPIFWVFTLARMLAAAWGTALIFHQISLFTELGHGAHIATNTYGQTALTTAFFTFFSGWWIDKIKPTYLVALQMLGLIAATGLAMTMTNTNLLLAYALAFGGFMGVGSVFDGTVWVSMFGRQHQGAIRGFVAMAIVMGTSVGPLVFGLAYDHLGSYNGAMWLGIGLALLILMVSLLVKPPHKQMLS